MSRFRFVHDHRDLYEVKRLCALAEVSRSGYYAWASRPPSARATANAAVLAEICEIHQLSRGTYGRPRICGQLRRRGLRVNHKRVAALMRHAGIVGVSNRRRWRASGPNRVPAPAPDLLERDFTATAPNQRWVADITEFDTGAGRLYLAAVLDLYARRIVGWAMDTTRTAELVVDALVMAIARRDPDEVLHHADRGSQYTSMRFVESESSPTSTGAHAGLLATICGSRCSTTSRSSTTAPATKPGSITAPPTSTRSSPAPHDHRNPVSTNRGQPHAVAVVVAHRKAWLTLWTGYATA